MKRINADDPLLGPVIDTVVVPSRPGMERFPNGDKQERIQERWTLRQPMRDWSPALFETKSGGVPKIAPRYALRSRQDQVAVFLALTIESALAEGHAFDATKSRILEDPCSGPRNSPAQCVWPHTWVKKARTKESRRSLPSADVFTSSWYEETALSLPSLSGETTTTAFRSPTKAETDKESNPSEIVTRPDACLEYTRFISTRISRRRRGVTTAPLTYP